jgi:hypothetical protein
MGRVDGDWHFAMNHGFLALHWLAGCKDNGSQFRKADLAISVADRSIEPMKYGREISRR